MGIAYEMKELTRGIASSHKNRTKNIHEIGKEVKEAGIEARDMIHHFKDSREEANRQLRNDLARDKAEMIAAVKATRSGFQSSREKMSSALKQDLTEHVEGLRGGVAKMRQETKVSHLNMSARLRKNLARGAAAVKSEGRVMLNGFQRSHKQMGLRLRKELGDYNQGIKIEVSGMQQETMADMKEARTAWQGLASPRQGMRNEIKTPLKAAAPAKKDSNSGLEEKLLATVNGYPAGGISLADLAKIMGVAPVVLGRVSKGLIEKGKIRKEGKLYFPASGGNQAV